jgi:hypothetical protein
MAFKKLLLGVRKRISLVSSPWGASGNGWSSAGVTGSGTAASKFSVAGPYTSSGSYPLGLAYITVATSGYVNFELQNWTSTPGAYQGDGAGIEIYSSVSATSGATQYYFVNGNAGTITGKLAVTAGNVVRLYSDDPATVWGTPMNIWWTAS